MREKTKLEATRRQAEYVGQILRSQMVNNSRAEILRTNSPDFHDQVASQLALLLSADAAVIVDLRTFHAPQPLTATTVRSGEPSPTVSPPTGGNISRRPSIQRQQSELSSGEWYSSSVGAGKAGRVSGEMGTVSILGSSGWDWSQHFKGAAASVSHFFITYTSVRRPLWVTTDRS